MRLFRKIRVQLVIIVLVCYLVPAAVLGVYIGGPVLGDLKVRSESSLLTGMD